MARPVSRSSRLTSLCSFTLKRVRGAAVEASVEIMACALVQGGARRSAVQSAAAARLFNAHGVAVVEGAGLADSHGRLEDVRKVPQDPAQRALDQRFQQVDVTSGGLVDQRRAQLAVIQ